MDCSLIHPLSLYSQTKSHNLSRFFKRKPGGLLFIEPNRTLSIKSTHSQKSSVFSFHPKTHLQSLSNFTDHESPSVQKSITNPLNNFQFFGKPKTNFLKPIAEKVAIIVFGSVLFMARLSCKPALALPTPTGIPGLLDMMETVYEKVGGGDEDENKNLKVLEKNPRDVDALQNVLLQKMIKGKAKDAVEYVEKLIEIEPDDLEWRLIQAFAYQMKGDLGTAKNLFKDMLEKNPLSLRPLHGLAMLMHKNREKRTVFQMLNKALEIARCEKRVGDERNIRMLIAQMHVLKGNSEEAAMIFRQLVSENPQDFQPLLFQVLHAGRVIYWTHCDDYIINYLLTVFKKA